MVPSQLLPPQRLKWLAFVRRQIRSSELWLIAVAVVAGAAAGALATVQSHIAHGLQILLFDIAPSERLSAQSHIEPWRVLAIPAGGLVLGLVTWLWTRRRPNAAVDPVEANALHGGRMSARDSAFICAQTLISNGSGASVGLEAAYAQAGGAAGSLLGRALALRRADLRTLVGAAAGAAIAAAFGAPLTGAFYAFEIVIGAYTVANIAPVAAAALAAVLVARGMHAETYILSSTVKAVQSWPVYGLYGLLGLAVAVFGVALMRLVATAEAQVRCLPLPAPLRPFIGGLALAAIALVTPQTLSAGHGALAVDLEADLGLKLIVLLIAMKSLASIISLSFGFRGGLFFATLFLGALIGQGFSHLSAYVPTLPELDPTVAALVGMGALGVAVIGGPLTMSFLVLETTGDFTVTAATLAASLIASAVVRETFGYSFSTWRLHLRGETIRSAHDVGWMRTLTAGRMMRKDVPTLSVEAGAAEFRRRFPLGGSKRVVLTDSDGRYVGLLRTADVYAEPDAEPALIDLAINREASLRPDMSIKEIMTAFDQAQTDELAVVDEAGAVLGVLSEHYAARRYADELEKARKDLTGEA